MTARNDTLTEILRTIPGNSSGTQCTGVMTAMQKLGSVTTFEGSRFLDCYDPRARIHQLRKSGIAIKTIMRPEQTESGVFHSVGVYLLENNTSQKAT
ncbi:helix-turn-helix domain-containing protein [Glaciimonas sp. GNP009]